MNNKGKFFKFHGIYVFQDKTFTYSTQVNSNTNSWYAPSPKAKPPMPTVVPLDHAVAARRASDIEQRDLSFYWSNIVNIV